MKLQQSKRRPIDLSIVLITYNHSNFVQKALDGIAMQNFNGTVELIISDDASKDDTQAIIQNAKFPEAWNLVFVFRQHNVGMNQNVLEALSKAKGEFVAIIEGDDYWTDSNKCSLQVDSLRRNSSFSFSWHSAEVKNWVDYPKSPDILYLEDALYNHYIPTASLLYRRAYLSNFPSYLFKAKSLDIALELLLLASGPAVFIDRTMSVRYKHPGGITSNAEYLNGLDHNRIQTLFEFNAYTKGKFKNSIFLKIHGMALIELNRASHRYNTKERLQQVLFLLKSSWLSYNLMTKSLCFILSKLYKWSKFKVSKPWLSKG